MNKEKEIVTNMISNVYSEIQIIGQIITTIKEQLDMLEDRVNNLEVEK